MSKYDQSIVENDSTFNNRFHLRSVLWPKICFTTLIKKTEHRQVNDQNQAIDSNKYRAARNARKCYPFNRLQKHLFLSYFHVISIIE